jgi:predicted TIM-barrel fold metal-dependent hydrolase
VRLESAGTTEAGAFRSPSRQGVGMSKMDDSNESILMIDAQGGGGDGRGGARRGNAWQRGKKKNMKKKKQADAARKPHELTKKEQLCLSHAGENGIIQHIGILSRFANVYIYISQMMRVITYENCIWAISGILAQFSFVMSTK